MTCQPQSVGVENKKKRIETISYESETVGEPWKCRSISMVLSSDQVVGGGLRGNFKWVPTWWPYFKRVKSCTLSEREREKSR